MQSLHSHGLQPLLPRLHIASLTFQRHASLTSAIDRGIRKGANSLDRIGTRRRDQDAERRSDSRSTGSAISRASPFTGRNNRERTTADGRVRDVRREQDDDNRSETSYATRSRSNYETKGSERSARSPFADRTQRRDPRSLDNSDGTSRYLNKGNKFALQEPTRPRSRFDGERSVGSRSSSFSRNANREPMNFGQSLLESDPQPTTPPRSRLEIDRAERPPRPQKRWGKEREPASMVSYDAPQGVPYTTAGSEFLYGTFAVKAALEAKRRQLHKLYVWKGEHSSSDAFDESISRLARSKRIKVEEVAGSWDRILMKMSGQRPHNGYVLEASPIPKLPITALQDMAKPSSPVIVSVPAQSEEDKLVNSIFESEGNLASIPRLDTSTRYPLLLWLDRITDTGNLGAIVRSAYFFGIDAIIIPEHGTAPLSPITIKASAGTAEYLPILTVRKELEFVKSSKERGWKFFAGVAPESIRPRRKAGDVSDPVSNALNTSPCVLMVGNEGDGLRGFMQRAADELITIDSVRDTSGVVDSLNVSVAAAILMARFVSPAKSPIPSQDSRPVQQKDLNIEPESTQSPPEVPLKNSEDMF